MALNVRPVLSTIPAFDAEFGTKGKEHIKAPILKFSWKDGVVRKNKIIIRDYDSNEEVYNCTITTMALKHQLHNQLDASEKVQFTTYKLQNGHRYIANVYVYTSDEIESLASNDVIFYCFNTPEFKFTNFDSYIGEGTTTALVNSSSVNLTVRYNQTDGEPLSVYKFELQDYNGSTLLTSNTKYSSLSEDTLRYTIGGVEETEENKYGDIQINRAYKVICSGQTQNGIEVYTEQRFVVKIDSSGVGALVRAKNVGDGTVAIYSNYKIINAQCSMENPIYVSNDNGEPYAIILSNGNYVEFTDGFNVKKPWEIIIKGKFEVDKLVTLTNPDGEIGYISLKKISYTTTPFYYFVYVIEKNGIEYEIRSEYFRYHQDTLINASIDLSYENGLYTLKTNIDYNGVSYILNDDGFGNVSLFLFDDSVIRYDEDNLELSITSKNISVSDDSNGNVKLTI